VNQFAKVENAVIGLFCPDPWFLDLLEEEEEFLSEVEETVVYGGDFRTGVQMTLTLGSGNGTEIVITNDRDTQSMTIDLTAIVPDVEPGWKIYIDTRVNLKSIILEAGDGETQDDILGSVGISEDWIELLPGDNVIKVTFDGTTDPDSPDDAIVEYFALNEDNDLANTVGLHASKELITAAGINQILHGPGPPNLYEHAREWDPSRPAYFSNGTPDADFNPLGDFAMSFWINQKTVVSSSDIIRSTDTKYGWEVYNGTGDLRFGLQLAPGYPGSWFNVTIPSFPTDTWAHVHFWWDSAADRIGARLNDGADSYATSVTGYLDTYSSVLTIGGRSGSSQYFDGKLQALIFYDRMLTSDERDFVYNRGLPTDYGRTYLEMIGTKVNTELVFRPKFQGV